LLSLAWSGGKIRRSFVNLKSWINRILKGSKIIEASPSLRCFYEQYIHFRLGEQSRYVLPYDKKTILKAYSYFLNSLIPPCLPEPSHAYRRIFDSVLANYKEAIKYLREKDCYQDFIGPGWAKFTKKFANVLGSNKSYEIFLTYGARSYKTLEYTRGKFNYRLFTFVQEAIELYEFLLEHYQRKDFPYGGYTELFYPHFYHNGIAINSPNSLSDLEMSLFLESRLNSVNVIAEIGAGDGGCCRELIRHKSLKYIIFDLPEILTRSHVFLATYYPEKSIAGFIEWEKYNFFINDILKDYDILLLPCWTIESMLDNTLVDMWINKHSLGEIPLEVSKRYCRIIDETGRCFVSVNRDRNYEHQGFREFGVVNYLKELKNLKVVSADYVISSVMLQLNPSYVRHFFEK